MTTYAEIEAAFVNTVHELLSATSEQIAALCIAAGVKGSHEGSRCPLAKYLTKLYPTVSVTVARGYVVYSEKDNYYSGPKILGDRHDTFNGIYQFTVDFDVNDKYKELYYDFV